MAVEYGKYGKYSQVNNRIEMFQLCSFQHYGVHVY